MASANHVAVLFQGRVRGGCYLLVLEQICIAARKADAPYPVCNVNFMVTRMKLTLKSF